MSLFMFIFFILTGIFSVDAASLGLTASCATFVENNEYLYLRCSPDVYKYRISDLSSSSSSVAYESRFPLNSNLQSPTTIVKGGYAQSSDQEDYYFLQDESGNLQTFRQNDWPYPYQHNLDYPFLFYNGWRTDRLKVYSWTRQTEVAYSHKIADYYNKIAVSRMSSSLNAVLIYHEAMKPEVFIFDRSSEGIQSSHSFSYEVEFQKILEGGIYNDNVVFLTPSNIFSYSLNSTGVQKMCRIKGSLIFPRDALEPIKFTQNATHIFGSFAYSYQAFVYILNSTSRACELRVYEFQKRIQDALVTNQQVVGITSSNQKQTETVGINQYKQLYPQVDFEPEGGLSMQQIRIIILSIISFVVLAAIIIIICCCCKVRACRMRCCCKESAIPRNQAPAPRQSMRRVPVFKTVKGSQIEHEECTICLEKMGNEAEETRCRHHFHKDCIMNWVGTKSSCPICRQPL